MNFRTNKRQLSPRGSSESSEAASTRQKTFRENVPLQYLIPAYAGEGELLAPLMNLVGEYSGAAALLFNDAFILGTTHYSDSCVYRSRKVPAADQHVPIHILSLL